MTKPSYALFAKSALDNHIAEFNDRLPKYFNARFGLGAHEYHQLVGQAADVFKEYTLRPAKRLRGSFVLRGYQMLTGKIDKWVWDAAIAVEVMHAYILVMDDFQDLSPERRQSPTVHEIFKKEHENNNIGDSHHYGISIASLVGMMGQHHATNILLELDAPDELRNRAAHAINDTMIKTVYGQIYDTYNQSIDNATEHDVLEVHRMKTAYYTYFNPLQLGFILAGASDEEIKKLMGYTEPAGIAFQIQDDILGVFGNPGVTGKSNMDDIMEGKATLLIVHAMERANSMERNILRNALGNRALGKEPALFKRVQEIIVKTGSLEYSKNVAKKLVSEAKESLYSAFSAPKYDNDGLKFIGGIADYMIEREL